MIRYSIILIVVSVKMHRISLKIKNRLFGLLFLSFFQRQLEVRDRIVSKSWSICSWPLVKTVSRQHFKSGSFWAFWIVSYLLSAFRTKASFPRFDFFTGSSMGAFQTSTFSPFTVASEHLKANLSVSRLCFWSRPPPQPRTTFSTLQPAWATFSRMISVDSSPK